MDRVLKIGGATVNQTPLDWDGNLANILAAIEEGKVQKVSILCFPELTITAYGCEDLFLSDWLSEKAWQQLLLIVPHCDSILVCVGLPIRLEGITYNGVAVIHHKKILGVTLKQNLARDGVHYEPRWFNAWAKETITTIERSGEQVQIGDVTYEYEGVRFGFEICEDAWRKNNRPGYRLAKRKIDLILNPSASHFALGKSQEREREVIIEGSQKFNCVYLFVNLLGNEAGRMIYDGDVVIGQHGKLIHVNRRLSFENFNLLTATVDFDRPEKTIEQVSQDNKERNEEFARAASLALFDYLRKSRAKGFVLSLSGGADSSCCAILVAEMVRRGVEELGSEKFCKKIGVPHKKENESIVRDILCCAYQGTRNSSQKTLDAAQLLAKSIGADFHHWSIDEEVSSYEKKIEKALGRPLTWEQDDIARQNIQARTRSPIIWMLANIKQSLLLTTSNRSEGDVGYATMDGDTSGSLAPIAGIDKPFIIQWLKWAEKELSYKGLSLVNSLDPTAELRPSDRNQTDEKDLMPYAVLVEIEKLAIQHRKTPVEVFQLLETRYEKKILKAYIQKFFKLWSTNQWKRERLAPSFHFDDINVDPRSWCRFPILSGGFKEEIAALDKL